MIIYILNTRTGPDMTPQTTTVIKERVKLGTMEQRDDCGLLLVSGGGFHIKHNEKEQFKKNTYKSWGFGHDCIQCRNGEAKCACLAARIKFITQKCFRHSCSSSTNNRACSHIWPTCRSSMEEITVEKLQLLIAQKDAIESELLSIRAWLLAPGNLGLSGGLVDEEGFPINDVDKIIATREARGKLARM